ncbi:UvrD-helicase domain-containing protein [Paludifilum halophilum]|uniref:UvrD-helicase domain-containing protein n=1 Tax=Paludifilum halophilum TaxID=1642702 RepID=UPI001F0B1602|nr:UvrD-helicase domain-containing protein [Paludifilum halophilum]
MTSDAAGLLPNMDLSTEQRAVIQQEEDQLLINGSAGSGKSVTLIYKLLKVMERERKRCRILYVTFNQTFLDDTCKRMGESDKFLELKEHHDLHLYPFHQTAVALLKEMGLRGIRPFHMSLQAIQRHQDKIKSRIRVVWEEFVASETYRRLPENEKLYKTHTIAFLYDEFMWIKANGYGEREWYLEVERTGRSQTPRLTKAQRKTVFTLFERYSEMMQSRYQQDGYDMEDYAPPLLLGYMDQIPDSLCYDYVFVDEAQDLQPMQIAVLARLRKKSIVLTGDPKQRIYRSTPHSYTSLGLNVQGRRNRTLRRNYRSTKQIMALANAIQFDDTENDREDNQHYINEGPKPEIRYFPKGKALVTWLVGEIQRIHREDPNSTVAVPCPSNIRSSATFHWRLPVNTIKSLIILSLASPSSLPTVASIKGLEFDYD